MGIWGRRGREEEASANQNPSGEKYAVTTSAAEREGML